MNSPAPKIREEIQRLGPISFARFMELALYAPGLGYYEQQHEIGKRGDFFTSVSVGPLFGELLAFQFSQWLGEESGSGKLQILEAGAHQGMLAADILRWMRRRRPELFGRLEYSLVEPSPIHRQWQERTLKPWLSKVKWTSGLPEAGQPQAYQIIFSNEFLDAMPVHRLVWNAEAKRWGETLVAWERDQFQWQLAPPSPGLAEHLPKIDAELAAVLPAGYVVEISPAAIAWWKSAATVLARGKLLTIDYGMTSAEWIRPERTEGTLRTLSRHHAGKGLFDNPGESDITAHVNFSGIEAAGLSAGLATEALMEQGKFLTQIMAQTESGPGRFDEWSPQRIKQFQTLTHPEHLGHAFRVLIQSREK